MKFEAKMVNGRPVIKAQCKRVKNKNGGWDVACQVPSLKIINKFREEQNGERDLQQIQS